MSGDYSLELGDNIKKLTAISAGLLEIGIKDDSFSSPFDQKAIYGFGLYLENMIDELQAMYDDLYDNPEDNEKGDKALERMREINGKLSEAFSKRMEGHMKEREIMEKSLYLQYEKKDLMARMKEIEEEEKALTPVPLSKEGEGLSDQARGPNQEEQ